MRLLRSDDICFDVGANLGYYTVLMAKAVPRGRVYAFEPDPLSHALLQLNVRMNRLGNVITNDLALGDRTGTSTFVQCTDSAFNSFKDTARRAVLNEIEVPVTTIDDFMVEHGVPRVDFVKMDVEGAEGLVLCGARNLLRNSALRPRMLLSELFDENHKAFGDSAAEIVESLRRSGYERIWPAGNGSGPDLINGFFEAKREPAAA